MKRRRHLLWLALTLVWSLLFVQALFPPDPHPHRSWVGGAFVIVVLIGLAIGTWQSWPRRRSEAE